MSVCEKKGESQRQRERQRERQERERERERERARASARSQGVQRQSQPLVVLALPFLLCCVFTLSIPGAERRRGDTAGGLRGSGCWELTKERPRSGGCDADHMLRPLLNRERGPTCIFVCTCVCMLASPHRLHHACIMLVSQCWFHTTHTHTHTHTHEDLVNVAAGIAEKHALALHLLTQHAA